MLYGDNYASGEENPYVATDLQLGIHPARLTNIQQVYEDDVIDGFFYGENFNTYSKVYINDEEMETDFIDNNTLMVRDCNIKYGDKVVVCQQDADGVILTQTDEFTYSEAVSYTHLNPEVSQVSFQDQADEAYLCNPYLLYEAC